MNRTTLNKLLLSRTLYHVAKDHARSTSGVSLSVACNLLQDSVESFLLALSEELNAGVGSNTTFDKYFDLLNVKTAPYELPFRQRLIALNKLRVNSKHYGLEPSRSEMEPIITTVWEFFDEVMRSRFGKAFATISLVDLLPDREVKLLLRSAEEAFQAEDYRSCLIMCRQALFVTFEYRYDSRPFSTKESSHTFAAMLSSVPHFARDQEYLSEQVKEPSALAKS